MHIYRIVNAIQLFNKINPDKEMMLLDICGLKQNYATIELFFEQNHISIFNEGFLYKRKYADSIEGFDYRDKDINAINAFLNKNNHFNYFGFEEDSNNDKPTEILKRYEYKVLLNRNLLKKESYIMHCRKNASDFIYANNHVLSSDINKIEDFVETVLKSEQLTLNRFQCRFSKETIMNIMHINHWIEIKDIQVKKV